MGSPTTARAAATSSADRVASAAYAAEATGRAGPGPEPNGAAMSRQSLVLIEDDAGDRLLVTDMLEGVDAGVELTCFTTLHAALDNWPPDAECVLLDLGLPDAMGLSALERLRAAV